MRSTGLCTLAAVVLLVSVWTAPRWLPAQDPQGVRQRDLIYVPQDEPRLRINAGGHTAAVSALAFTPDSVRLCSAGLDKVVQVWNLRVLSRDLQAAFLRERTLRWQVARGLRGSIYALASAPSDGLLAIGGYGAMGSLGEILLVDPVAGILAKVLEGHKQAICSLAFSADGSWLASQDADGRAILWKRGDWKPTTLYDPDTQTYGLEKARLIGQQPKLRPITIAGNSHVVVPVLADQRRDGRLLWKLQQISLADPQDFRTLDAAHSAVVTALAATADGSRLASADLEGNLYLWDLRRGTSAQRIEPGAVVASLCFSPDGRTLAVGTAAAGSPAHGQLQVWDLQTLQLKRRQTVPDSVQACAISPDGQRLAYTGGEYHEVFVESLSAPQQQRSELRGKGRRVLKVAFAKEEPLYRVAFGAKFLQRGFNDYADLEETFDPVQLKLGGGASGGGPLNPADWLASDWSRGTWEAKWRSDGTLQLYSRGVAQGVVSLASNLDEGVARCYCWIPDREGKPYAIAVGTDRQNSIYVCRLVEKGPCPILRHFRGHHDYVTSLGVSRDLRYLVSGSADGTLGFWSLAACEQGQSPFGRWGAELAVEQDRLVVKNIHPAGPLYSKGVRQGDVLTEIRWYADREGQTLRSQTRAAAILENLQQVPWGTQVLFQYAREGVARPGFMLLPAWQPLATLFVGSDQEWAFWTPEGYYDASVNGYTLFGWQVNRGLYLLPQFYRADQFCKKLEQPGVMEQLLPAGSLQEALRRAKVEPAGELQNTVPQQIALAPTVRILEPRHDAVVPENSARVRAEVSVPAASKLVDAKVKVYASGVVATKQPTVQTQQLKDGTVRTYEWDVPLPTEQQSLIQLVVGTDTEVTASGDVVIRRPKPARPSRPKLYILAAGINEYRDPKIKSLESPVADAQAVLEALKTWSGGLYAVDTSLLLTNADVTPQKWQASLQEIRNKLKDHATADDLLVLFLAGHGEEDMKTRKYYYIGHDFKLEDFGKVYTDCISWDDFQMLADIPCRKLALLDTCKSGAIQPPRSQHLKAAVRSLQEDVIFTVTAATGDQMALEPVGAKHGIFTSCLLEALQGRADQTGDGLVTLNEAVTYVKQMVPKTAEALLRSIPESDRQGQVTQQPTAAPDEILSRSWLPLTQAEKPPATPRSAPPEAPPGPVP